MDTLFIIGNGFDISHDMKTSYLYFKKFVYEQAYGEDELLSSLESEGAIKTYLQSIDTEIIENVDDIEIPEMQIDSDGDYVFPSDKKLFKLFYQLFSQIADDGKCWGDFEEKLADFDKVDLETTKIFDHEGDINHFVMASNAEDTGETLSSYLTYSVEKLFQEWIKQTYEEWKERVLLVDEGHHYRLRKSTILHNSDAVFLNFNYTRTLEDFYGIVENQICHIHGSIGDRQLVFGHGSQDESDDFNPLNPSTYLDRVVSEFRKPVYERLKKSQEFFEQFSTVKKIYIIGFKICDGVWVDAPYIRKIFESASNANIYVDEYDKWNVDIIKKVLTELGSKKAYDLQFINTDKDEIVKVK